MHKLILASLLCAIAACADMPTQQTTGCIRGDPGGSVPSWLANRFVIDAPLETLRTLRAVAERQPRPAPQ